MRRLLSALAAVAASVLVLAGCSSAAPADDGRVQVVASTSVYGQIAQAVGGDLVDVTSIISKASQDPHEFEATAQDQLLVSRADLVIENGGGYDPFVDALIEASGSKAPVLTAVEFSSHWTGGSAHGDSGGGHDHVEGFNEHVFYDVAAMADLAKGIASKLGAMLPKDAATFEAHAATFADGVAKIQASLESLATAHRGQTVFVTEPVPLYLTEAAGLDNATPEAFSEAVEEGQDVPPATLLDALKIVPTVSVVITNAQAAGAETTQVEQAAKDAGIPVLSFSELLPDGSTYLEWMQHNVDELTTALGS